MMNIKDYIYAFSHLRKGVTKFGPAPHKLILLLAVIREIEAGRVVQNRIAVTDALIESFMTVWNENVHSGHTATFALPFFHLLTESGKKSSYIQPMRQKLLDDKVLSMQNGKLIFIKEYKFDTPSGGSSIILGYPSNGWNDWQDIEDRTLDEYYRK